LAAAGRGWSRGTGDKLRSFVWKLPLGAAAKFWVIARGPNEAQESGMEVRAVVIGVGAFSVGFFESFASSFAVRFERSLNHDSLCMGRRLVILGVL
jgi:hypothetical protein